MDSLPYFPYGHGNEFPAFLTHKSGIDKMIFDMMRPLFHKGFRPEALSGLLLEMRSKQYNRQWLRHERCIAARCLPGNTTKSDLFSDFTEV